MITVSRADLYYEELGELACNAMLHALLKAQYKKGFTPMRERNEILIKYLKEKQQLPKWKPYKKEIKTMLLLARKGGDLLARLGDINRMILNC
ncbi:DUF2913 family protein [Moritella viscosa]|nr:DUF2913 family protein [Moritella viscosa]SHO15808.1 Putative uncharacterized protein [Moritella viscosa]